jgi:hypothetical protein
VRLRPGGFFPARLVAADDGLGAGDGEAEGDEGGEEEPPRAAEDRPEEMGAPAALVAGVDAAGRAAPTRSPPAPAEPPALWPPHGMIEAPGPPSRPTAITIRQATSAPPAHIPTSRIWRTRRPEGSVNTGRA